MDEERRRTRRLSTITSARQLGSLFVLVGMLVALAAPVLSVWQEAVVEQGVAIVPAIDAVLAGWPDVHWLQVVTAVVLALAVAGFGYALKVLSILAETQLVDFGPPRA